MGRKPLNREKGKHFVVRDVPLGLMRDVKIFAALNDKTVREVFLEAVAKYIGGAR